MCTKNVKCILEKIYSKSNKRAIKEECEIYISRLDDMSLVYMEKVLKHDNKKFQEIRGLYGFNFQKYYGNF